MSEPLMLAAGEVCRAVEAHAQACLADAYDVVGIIGAGERLVAAVLEYERRLSDTGWSNPLRHLGRLPMYESNDEYETGAAIDATEGVRVRVAANYLVEVRDEELLGNLVESRGGDRPPGVEEAVRCLFESDSWDVGQYPPGRLRLVEADVDISAVD